MTKATVYNLQIRSRHSGMFLAGIQGSRLAVTLKTWIPDKDIRE